MHNPVLLSTVQSYDEQQVTVTTWTKTQVVLFLKIFIYLDSIQTKYEGLFKFPNVIRFLRDIAMLLDLLKLFQFLPLLRALLSLFLSFCICLFPGFLQYIPCDLSSVLPISPPSLFPLSPFGSIISSYEIHGQVFWFLLPTPTPFSQWALCIAIPCNISQVTPCLCQCILCHLQRFLVVSTWSSFYSTINFVGDTEK